MTSIIIFVTLLIIIIVVIVLYNKMVRSRNRMHEAWSGINVFLKKRYDLVPNLVEAVKGYADYEKSTLEEVTRSRTEAIHASTLSLKAESEMKFEKALTGLFAVVENYPDLKASSSFLKLQEQLAKIENEIEMSRRYYNGTVRENNILLESFPSNLVAGLFNFRKGDFFNIDDSERRVSNLSL